jgi:hypothetical protein
MLGYYNEILAAHVQQNPVESSDDSLLFIRNQMGSGITSPR